MENQLTFLFAPLNAWGHINACSAIASVLKEKFGHRIIFIINPSWKGQLTSFGFQEEVYGDSFPGNSKPSQDWTNFVTQIGPIMRLSSLEKIKTFGLEAQNRMVGEIMESNEQIKEILARTKPDLILFDNYVLAPALVACGIPYVRLRSANPIEINQMKVPPQNSGYSSLSDISEWNHFTQTQNETYKPLWEKFSAWFSQNCKENLPPNEFILSSPYLNLYLYPQEIDYTDLRPMPDKWYQIDYSSKKTYAGVEKRFNLPKKMKDFGNGKIVYVSLGTFGSADLSLMTRIVEFLSQMPEYRFIVSKGPFHEKYDLPNNCWGEGSLPQTEILAIVDGVICHGGNATLNECFYFGRPMIILPIFGDEYDNAQRIAEKGYGVRFDPYGVNLKDLSAALAYILGDSTNSTVSRSMKEASARIQNAEGSTRVAELILSILKT